MTRYMGEHTGSIDQHHYTRMTTGLQQLILIGLALILSLVYFADNRDLHNPDTCLNHVANATDYYSLLGQGPIATNGQTNSFASVKGSYAMVNLIPLIFLTSVCFLSNYTKEGNSQNFSENNSQLCDSSCNSCSDIKIFIAIMYLQIDLCNYISK